MKRLIALACLATVAMTAGAAMADDIQARFAVTGRIGVVMPADNRSDFQHNHTDAGFTGGAGLIYGLDHHFAAEFEVSRGVFDSQSGDFGVTDISLGGQYRFATGIPPLVPYLGAGLDVLVSDYDRADGDRRDVETTLGAHASAGVDYFISKQFALTAEAKVVLAPDARITDRLGVHRGDFDPSSLSTTVGIRYLFN